MNATRLAIALAGALLAGTSYAFDATEFVDPPSAATGIPAAQGAPAVVPSVTWLGEATHFADAPSMPSPSRQAVQREAALAPAHQGMDDCPYVGG